MDNETLFDRLREKVPKLRRWTDDELYDLLMLIQDLQDDEREGPR
jgi:hypothetical protein